MNAERAGEALRTGSLIAVLTLPQGFGAAVDRGETVAISLQIDNLNTDLMGDVQRAVPAAVLAFGADLGLPGLRAHLLEKDLQPRDVEFLQYVSVSALGLDALIIGAVLGALALAREWERRTMAVIRLAPARLGSILAGKIAGTSVVTGLAVGVATALVVVGYRVRPTSPLGAAAGLALCTAAFVAFGACVGCVLRRAALIVPSIFAAALPLYVDCGALEPTRFDGERIWSLAHASPLYYATGMLEWAFHGVRITPEPIWLDASVVAAFGLGSAFLGRMLLHRAVRARPS
jgi:ABC-type Na+ efflux pump permease subunit